MTRDTSGDALADWLDEQSRRERGEFDPPKTLTGPQAVTVRDAMLDAEAVLTRVTTKEPRLARDIRESRIKLGAALAYFKLPEKDPSA